MPEIVNHPPLNLAELQRSYIAGSEDKLSTLQEAQLLQCIVDGRTAATRLEEAIYTGTPMFAPERNAIYQSIRDEQTAIEVLCRANEGMVVKVATRLWQKNDQRMDLDDLLQIGRTELFCAIVAFDVTSDTIFSAHARERISAKIQKSIDEGQIITLPSAARDTASNFTKLVANGRSPEEAARHLRRRLDTIQGYVAALATSVESYDNPTLLAEMTVTADRSSSYFDEQVSNDVDTNAFTEKIRLWLNDHRGPKGNQSKLDEDYRILLDLFGHGMSSAEVAEKYGLWNSHEAYEIARAALNKVHHGLSRELEDQAIASGYMRIF